MAITINKAFVQQFTDMVRHLAQQGDTRLRPHVYETPANGEKYNFDRLGATNANEKTGRRVATPFVDAPWSRRVAQPRTFNWADTIEHEDKVQMLIDPQSAYAQTGAMSMRRSQDDIIIDALGGNALDGDGGNNALPAGQKIGTAGNSTQALDVSTITQVNEKFQANEVDPDEPKCFVISPAEVRTILNDTTLTSADYLSVKALQANGMVPNFMGFTWVLSNRLKTTSGTNNSRACYAFTKRGMGLTVNQDIFVRIAERADLSHLIQVFLQWTMGSVRVEDEHVVEVNLRELFA